MSQENPDVVRAGFEARRTASGSPAKAARGVGSDARLTILIGAAEARALLDAICVMLCRCSRS
jgi:hypothetical protein